MSKFTRSYKIRGNELDQSYRMRKIFAAPYFQECFAEKCASLTLAGYDMQKIGLTWIITDMRLDFVSDKMPFWRDEVVVDMWASSKSALFLTADFDMTANGNQIAKASNNWLLADDKTHKPVRLSPHGDKFEIVSENAFDNEHFAKFVETDCIKTGELERIIPSSEVDFNGHLTNIQYAPTAFEAIPIEYRNTRELRSYRIKFMREAFLGEKLISEAFDCGGGRFFHKIARINDGAVLCCMESFWE